jgi:two-component system phosphate regulon response regulator PhoB
MKAGIDSVALRARRKPAANGSNGIVVIVGMTDAEAAMLAHWSARRGFHPLRCKNAREALQCVKAPRTCLVLLPQEVSGTPAATLCEGIRRDGFRGSILCVSRATDVRLESAVLRAGADDFAASQPVERLLARVDAALRRAGGLYSRVMELGPVVIDHSCRAAYVRGKQILLTRTEFDLLTYLIAHRDRLVSAEEISREVLKSRWGRVNVKRHISRIRTKLGAARGALQTVRGSGYRFAAINDTNGAR